MLKQQGLIFEEVKSIILKKILPFLFSFWWCFLFGQTTKYPVTGIPVERNGLALQNAWAGGLNAPQFYPIDLNGDGINDLFVFDRGSNKVLTFLNDGSHSDTAFHYAPEYEHVFPAMTQYAVIRDYNHDGVPDIFTYQAGGTNPQGQAIPVGIEVYKGSRVNGNLHFDVVQYCLNFSQDGFTVNILPNALGAPGFIDVNGDGDLDILAFGIYGTTITYFENQTVEMGLNPDSMIFNQVSSCWGNIYVSNSTLGVSLNVSCKGGTGQEGGPEDPRHTGAALSALRYGNDANVDAILSGAHVDFMALLKNTGDASYANIGWVDTLWPQCNVPVQMPLFPGAYQLDAENDGSQDLLISPLFSISSEDAKNVMLYRYINGDSCYYQYSGNDSFLVSTMLDFGTDSKAVFFDYNGDGLMDIVVGNYYYYNRQVLGTSQLALYKNVGTRTQPRFVEISKDWAGLSQYSLAGEVLGYNPAFGDLDGDGKPDMLAGDVNGDLFFFRNEGDSEASYPSMTISNYESINVGGDAAPFIYDVNGDSLPDLIIGNMNGTLSYYWNYGTRSNPKFSADSVNTYFGGVNVTNPASTIGNSQPFIMRDSTGNMLLFVGSDQGLVFEYLIDPAKLRTGTFTLLDTNFLNYNAGARVTMQANDLAGNGKLEYLAGNALGGLQMFSDSLWDSSNVLSVHDLLPDNGISIYPNPANQQFTCVNNGRGWKNAQPELYDIFGEKIPVSFNTFSDKLVFSSAGLTSGLYVLRIISDGQVFNTKVLVQH